MQTDAQWELGVACKAHVGISMEATKRKAKTCLIILVVAMKWEAECAFGGHNSI
jgi:hypothetical protein